jgi:hypothetical protein
MSRNCRPRRTGSASNHVGRYRRHDYPGSARNHVPRNCRHDRPGSARNHVPRNCRHDRPGSARNRTELAIEIVRDALQILILLHTLQGGPGWPLCR